MNQQQDIHDLIGPDSELREPLPPRKRKRKRKHKRPREPLYWLTVLGSCASGTFLAIFFAIILPVIVVVGFLIFTINWDSISFPMDDNYLMTEFWIEATTITHTPTTGTSTFIPPQTLPPTWTPPFTFTPLPPSATLTTAPSFTPSLTPTPWPSQTPETSASPSPTASLTATLIPTCAASIESQLLFENHEDRVLKLFGGDAAQPHIVSLDVQGIWPQWSPDGSQITFQTGESTERQIYVMDTDVSNVRYFAPTILAGETIRWSADSRYLGFARNRPNEWTCYLTIMDTTTSNVTVLSERHAGCPITWNWSPDGRRIAFEEMQDDEVSNLIVANVDGSQRVLIAADIGTQPQPSWSPDGQLLAYQNREASMIEIIDMTSLAVMRRFEGQWNSTGVTWSPDGRSLAYNTASGIAILDLASGSVITISTDPDWETRFFGWSPDDSQVLFSARLLTTGEPGVYGMELSSENVTHLYDVRYVDHPNDQHMIVAEWSPNGRFVAIRDTEIFVVGADGTGLKQLTLAGKYRNEGRWSPDGRYLAFQGDDHALLLFDTASGEVCLVEQNEFNYSFDWRPVGGTP